MKYLYFNLSMGAAGDMIGASLLNLMDNADEIIDELNSFEIPGVVYSKEDTVKCGICGTHLTVTINGEEELCGDEIVHEHDGHTHHHHHSSLKDIEHIVRSLKKLPVVVQDHVMDIYKIIANAESEVHGVSVTDIHFHEVGTMDAIADIVASCYIFHKLSPDEIVASPIHVGSGQVRCAHGILPVPAPATARILRNVPIYTGTINGELCTPTGAAILKHFVTRFGSMPVMKLSSIGYGMGKKDFGTANCICAMLGEGEGSTDCIIELSCNVDDMSAEHIAFATECLLDAGALDVYTIPITMKKSRPATLIRVMCSESDKDKIVRTIFKHTSTIGIREQTLNRYVLNREVEDVTTPYGTVRKKTVSGYGVERYKYEYEDLSRIAKDNDLSLADIGKILD